jgi:hypothetical protein
MSIETHEWQLEKDKKTYLKIFSVDVIDIKWNLWNEHFIEYYNEVIIYIDNR